MKQYFMCGAITITILAIFLLVFEPIYAVQIPIDKLAKLDKYVVAIGLKAQKQDKSTGKLKEVKVVLGAGVLVKKYKRKILVTAKHVVFANGGKGKVIPNLWIWGKKVDGNDFEYSYEKDYKGTWGEIEWIKHSDDEIDIAATIIGTESGVDIVEFLPFEEYKFMAEAKKGNDVYYLGFPTAIFSVIEKDHVNVSTPVLRKGMIAVNEKEERYFYIDAVVAKGNSGGPVFKLEENGDPKLLGIVQAFLKFKDNKEHFHSGLGIVYEADCIEELLDSIPFRDTF